MKVWVVAVAGVVLVGCGDDERFAPSREAAPLPPDSSGIIDAAPDAMPLDMQVTLTGPTSIAEGDSGTYTVTLTGDPLPAGETVTVTITTGPGADPNLTDATASSDYELIDPIDSDIVFTGGAATMVSREIPTIEDVLPEGDEDFLVGIQTPRASAGHIRVTINSSGIVGVVIIDDDA